MRDWAKENTASHAYQKHTLLCPGLALAPVSVRGDDDSQLKQDLCSVWLYGAVCVYVCIHVCVFVCVCETL